MKKIPRIIGSYDSGKNGTLLFITAGIHGNEPAGMYALEKVFKILHEQKPEIKGKVIGLTGNRRALQENKRFIDEDLNRTWTEENVNSGEKNSHEKIEMFEIIAALEKFPEKDFTERYFLDCHTTSAPSEPYISVQDIGNNLDWAKHFPTYIIIGFSDIVKGCIDHYESRIGMTGFVFEGGQHESEVSKENHEAVIWQALKYACFLDFKDLAEEPQASKMFDLKKKNAKTFQVKYRHGIENGESFTMEPRFTNFQKIKKGELLARHNDKPIYSNWDAHIFMPLYQEQGNDGFFIITEI